MVKVVGPISGGSPVSSVARRWRGVFYDFRIDYRLGVWGGEAPALA
jgi:hypothetical protein